MMTGDGVDWGSTLCAALNRLREEGAFSDTTVIGNDHKTFRAHACVLAAASLTLKACLDLAKESVYTVRVGHMSSITWRSVLQFVYTGQVPVVPESSVASLLKAANTLQIRGLQTSLLSQAKLETAVSDKPVAGKKCVEEPLVEFEFNVEDPDPETVSSTDDSMSAVWRTTAKKTVAKRSRMRRHQPPAPGPTAPEEVNPTTINSEHENGDDATQAENANGVNKSAADGKAKPASLCSVCGKVLASSTCLSRHMRLHSVREKAYRCDICNSRFLSPQALTYHSRRHTGELPYMCHVCGKLFTSLTAITYHTKIHNGEKPFACDICGKDFRSLTGLKVHRRGHTGEKPYACNVCGESFITAGRRAEHAWVHDGKKPHQCDLCDKAYTSSTKMKRHRRIHTGDKPFECETCGQCFSRQTTLKTHVTTHHTLSQRCIRASQEW